MEQLLINKIDGFQGRIEQNVKLLQLPPKERIELGFDHDVSGIKRSKNALAHYVLFKESLSENIFTENEKDIAMSLTKAFITDQQYLSKLVASLDPFLEKMTTGDVAKLISPDFSDITKDTFDWGSVIQSGGIVYVGLDALSDQEVARTVGASMLADLTSVYGNIYKEGRNSGLPDIGRKSKPKDIRVHIDEGNEPADKTLIPSLNKAGGAGVSVTVYTQTSSDLEARLGNKAFANQMLGNFNTIISFRVQDEDTAKIFTSKQNQVTVSDLVTYSSAGDSSDIYSEIDFTSSNQSRLTQDKVQLISTVDLTKLPKGQFFVMMDGNKLFKGRVPWLEMDDSGIPNDVRKVAEHMRISYQSDVPDWYSYEDYFNPIKTLNQGETHDAASEFIASLETNLFDEEGLSV